MLPLLSLQACKEDTLDTYLDGDGGSNIYFAEKFNRTSFDVNMKAISLGLTPLSVTDTLIQIPIKSTGVPVNVDRTVKISVVDTSSMKEGIHFDFVSTPMIRAGRVVDTLNLILHRTEDLTALRVYLKLKLDSNENFNTAIPSKVNANSTQDLLSYEFYFDDKLPVSFLWTTFTGKSTVIAYWGEYSRKKVQLMIDVMNADPGVFFDSTRRPATGTLISWASYMKFWLAKEKNEGRIYYDENGKEILMGASAS